MVKLNGPTNKKRKIQLTIFDQYLTMLPTYLKQSKVYASSNTRDTRMFTWLVAMNANTYEYIIFAVGAWYITSKILFNFKTKNKEERKIFVDSCIPMKLKRIPLIRIPDCTLFPPTLNDTELFYQKASTVVTVPAVHYEVRKLLEKSNDIDDIENDLLNLMNKLFC